MTVSFSFWFEEILFRQRMNGAEWRALASLFGELRGGNSPFFKVDFGIKLARM